MRAIVRLFRQKRPFALEQMTGLVMLVGSLLLYVRPQAITFDWFETLYGIRPGLLANGGMLLLLVAGFALTLTARASPRRFAALSLPIAGFGFIQIWFALSNPSASFLPGYFVLALYLCLQVAHDTAEVIRSWMKHSEPS